MSARPAAKLNHEWWVAKIGITISLSLPAQQVMADTITGAVECFRSIRRGKRASISHSALDMALSPLKCPITRKTWYNTLGQLDRECGPRAGRPAPRRLGYADSLAADSIRTDQRENGQHRSPRKGRALADCEVAEPRNQRPPRHACGPSKGCPDIDRMTAPTVAAKDFLTDAHTIHEFGRPSRTSVPSKKFTRRQRPPGSISLMGPFRCP